MQNKKLNNAVNISQSVDGRFWGIDNRAYFSKAIA